MSFLDRLARTALDLGTAPLGPARARAVSCAPEDFAAMRRSVDAHGWAIARGALTPSEIEALRDGLRAAHLAGHGGDALSFAPLRRFALHPRVIGAMREVLGGDVLYFGDTSYSWTGQPTAGAIGFHKDCTDKDGDGSAPDWQDELPIARVGIYLHDYRRWSGGLAIRDGSHRFPESTRGIALAVPSSPGDLAMWSLRTTHSGFISRLRGTPGWLLPVPLQARLTFRDGSYRPGRLFRPAPPGGTRPALFLTYGRKSPALDRYLRYLKTRRFAVATWQKSTWDETARTDAARAGVGLLDLPSEVRSLDLASLNEHHVALGT